MDKSIRQKSYKNLVCCILLVAVITMLLSVIMVYGKSSAVGIVEEEEEYDLTNQILILEDQQKAYKIEDIVSGELEGFVPFKESNLSGVISDSAYWFKVAVHNNTSVAQNMFIEVSKPHLNKVVLYRYSDNELIKETHTGRYYPFDKREVKHRNFVFEMNLLPLAEENIYFRVETESYLQFPIKLYKTQHFLEKEYKAQLVFGTYYGIMLVMFLYNLVLYLSLKDKTYLFYVLYVLGFSIMQLIWDGLAFQYLWPMLPVWDTKSNPFFLTVTAIFAVQFSRRFLRVKEKSSLLDKLISYYITITTSLGVLTFFISPSITTKLAVYAVSIGLIICITNIVVVRFRDSAVYLYCAAWGMLFLGVILNLLAAYRILPLNSITLYSPRIGSICEVVLLSLALVDRFNKIKQEKIVEEKQRVLLKTLHDITKTLTSTHDLDVLVKYILKSVADITKHEKGLLILKQQHQYIIKDALGKEENDLRDKVLDTLEEDPIFWRILLENKAITLSDVDMKHYYLNKTVASFTGIPIVYHEELLGIIVLYSLNRKKTNDFESKIIYDFAGQVGISIQNLRLFNEIKRMATTDGLTGVCNRKHFTDLAEAAFLDMQKSTKSLSLVMIDIDYFKQINDTYGHIAGDKVLLELVSTLKEVINTKGIIGRYGGEEFLVLLKDTNINEAYRLAELMRRSVEGLRILVDDVNAVRFTISIGVSNFKKDMKDIWELIDEADQALYVSKESGRNLVNIS